MSPTRSLLFRAAFVGVPLAVLLAAGCSDSGSSSTGKSKGANSGSSAAAPQSKDANVLLRAFLAAGADGKALSKAFRPAPADYAAVFTEEYASKIQKAHEAGWDSGEVVIMPKAGQTELLLMSATTEDIREWNAKASAALPGGWKDVGKALKPGLLFYRFKFVEPGRTMGMSYDGLIFVNDHWAWFPKPYRVVGGGAD